MHKSTFAQIPLFQLPFSSLRVLCRRGQRKQRTQGDLEQKKEREKEPKNKVAFTKHYCKKLESTLTNAQEGFYQAVQYSSQCNKSSPNPIFKQGLPQLTSLF